MMKAVICMVMVLLLSACEIVEQPPLYKGVVVGSADKKLGDHCIGFSRSQWIEIKDKNGKVADVYHCSNFNEGSIINRQYGLVASGEIKGYVIRESNEALRFVLKDEYDPEAMQAISL